jgi:hypothetical protein
MTDLEISVGKRDGAVFDVRKVHGLDLHVNVSFQWIGECECKCVLCIIST